VGESVVGASVGGGLGAKDGAADGANVGANVGEVLGFRDGTAVGAYVGACVRIASARKPIVLKFKLELIARPTPDANEACVAEIEANVRTTLELDATAKDTRMPLGNPFTDDGMLTAVWFRLKSTSPVKASVIFITVTV
jgi:hypothetical protein